MAPPKKCAKGKTPKERRTIHGKIHPGRLVSSFLKKHGKSTKKELADFILKEGEITTKDPKRTAKRCVDDAINLLNVLGMIECDTTRKGDDHVYWKGNPIIKPETAALEKVKRMREAQQKQKDERDNKLRTSSDHQGLKSRQSLPAVHSSVPSKPPKTIRKYENCNQVQCSGIIIPKQTPDVVVHAEQHHSFCQFLQPRSQYVQNEKESDDPPSLVNIDYGEMKNLKQPPVSSTKNEPLLICGDILPPQQSPGVGVKEQNNYAFCQSSSKQTPTYCHQGTDDDPPSLVDVNNVKTIHPSNVIDKQAELIYEIPQIVYPSPSSPPPASSHNENFVNVSSYSQYGPGPSCNDVSGGTTSLISCQKLTPLYQPSSNNNNLPGGVPPHNPPSNQLDEITMYEYTPFQPYAAVAITPQYSDVVSDPFVLEEPLHNTSYYLSSTMTSSTSGMMNCYPHPMHQHSCHPSIANSDEPISDDPNVATRQSS